MIQALLFDALMAGAALETFWRGSPTRWTVVAIAAAYAIARAVSWHAAPPTKAAISAIAFGSLLAIPAWLPGGLDNGVRLLGLSTSTVLSMAVALGIGIGAAIVSADAKVPRAIRWLVAGLGAYGVMAFAHGIATGVSFQALLSGTSVWTRLPMLLQGTVIGSLVVLAPALLRVIVYAGMRRPQAGTMTRAVQQATAYATSLLIVLNGLSFAHIAPSHVPSTQPQASALAPPAAASDSPGKAVDEMNLLELADRGDQLAGRVKRSEWNALAKAEELGPGIEPAFAFVRDQIGYEPYQGVLRGAFGTYAARAGNAVDRALLLAELLRAKGITTRFAIGTLGPAEVERLFLHAFDRPTTTAVGDARQIDQGDQLHGRLFRRARQDYDAVRAALGGQLKPVTAPARESVVAEMNPHVWLQAQVAGDWIDLETSFTDSTPGRALAALDRTIEQLPGDQHQQVTIRVISERLSAGALVPSTHLELTRNAIDLIDTPIVLLHTRPPAATGIGSAIARSFGQRIGDHWMPALWIAGTFTFGTALDAAAGDFVAEWLEFELAWPDGRREVTRRPLVDRGGPAWRAGAPLDFSGLTPVALDENGALAMQAVHNIWFSAGRHRLSDFADATRIALLDEAVRAIDERDRQSGVGGNPSPAALPDDDLTRQVWPFVLQNFASMILTDNVIVPLLDNTPGVRLYAAAPRITIFSAGPVGPDTFATSMDLRRDDLRGIAIDSSKGALVADKKLRFGALQAALEHESVAEVTAISTGTSTGVRSTSSMLAGKRLTAFDRGGSLPSADRDGSAEIAEALRGNRIVVAAAGDAPMPHAWWEILPETGDARAIAELGLRGSRTPPIDRNNPFAIKRKIQQNPWGGQKTYDLRSPAEKRLAEYQRRLAEAEEKAAAEAARYNKGLTKPEPPRGGGSEHAVLLTIGVVAKVAIDVLMFIVLTKFFEQIELTVSWLADGGFRANWP